MIVDPNAVGHYPYYVRFAAPLPFPIFNVAFLDPARPLREYCAKAKAATHHKPSWLVLSPRHAIIYRGGCSPEASTPPRGSFHPRAIAWDWEDGIEPRFKSKMLVQNLHRSGGFNYHRPFPRIAVEIEEGFYVAVIQRPWEIAVEALLEKTFLYAIRTGRTYFLALNENRSVKFSANGSRSEAGSLPKTNWFSHVAISTWPEDQIVPC